MTKKIIKYSTPKKIQAEAKRKAGRLEPKTFPGKRRYPCKRLKGEHDFDWVESRTSWGSDAWEERCKACGKKNDWYWPSKRFPTLELFLKADPKKRHNLMLADEYIPMCHDCGMKLYKPKHTKWFNGITISAGECDVCGEEKFITPADDWRRATEDSKHFLDWD